MKNKEDNKETKKKGKRGGARKGAGAKPRYNEKTKIVSFRCPISREDEFKLVNKSILSNWENK